MAHGHRSWLMIIFAYDFPHKKTQDILLRLTIEELKPTLVIASPWEKLNVAPASLRVKPRHCDLVHPRDVCAALGIEYRVLAHNSEDCVQALREAKCDIGVVAGARILKQPVIDAISVGIINLHPGLLPQMRGLDALQWSIYENQPLGVTAHVIDKRVDAGLIIAREVIKEYPDDTLIDLSLRLQQTEINMVAPAVRHLQQHGLNGLDAIPVGLSYHRKMPAELEATLPQLLQKRLVKKVDSR